MVLIVNASIPIFWDSQLAYLGTNTFWYIPSQREWEILSLLRLSCVFLRLSPCLVQSALPALLFIDDLQDVTFGTVVLSKGHR